MPFPSHISKSKHTECVEYLLPIWFRIQILSVEHDLYYEFHPAGTPTAEVDSLSLTMWTEFGRIIKVVTGDVRAKRKVL
jgi:hypothetical protein